MTNEGIIFHPIGYIHSKFNNVNETPKNSRNTNEAWMEIDLKYLEAMCDMKVGEEYMLIFYFNQSKGYKMKVPLMGDGPITGLFSTHAPCRPNPIGVSNITIKEIDKNKIKFIGVDMLDGTPILDIKNAVKS